MGRRRRGCLRAGCRDPRTDSRAEPWLLDAPGGWWTRVRRGLTCVEWVLPFPAQ
jgi:hypothetical protein